MPEVEDKRIDPEYDTQVRCKMFREKLAELNTYYRQELLPYKIVGDFYIGDMCFTHLPDKVRFSVTTRKTY